MPLSSLAQRVLPSRSAPPIRQSMPPDAPQPTFDEYFDEVSAGKTDELALQLRRARSDAQSTSTSWSVRRSRTHRHSSFSSDGPISMRRLGSPGSFSETLHSENLGHAYDRMLPSQPAERPETLGDLNASDSKGAASLMLRVASFGLLRNTRRADLNTSTHSPTPEASTESASQASDSDAGSLRRVQRTLKQWYAQCRARLSF